MLFGASDTFSDDKIMQLSCIQPFWNLKVVNLAGYRSNFWNLKIVFDLIFLVQINIVFELFGWLREKIVIICYDNSMRSFWPSG
jgi:hypothetical protein